jgi:hypothetical protein
MRDYFAKATFIPSGEFFASDADLLKRLADPKWNPRSSILYATSGPGAGRVYNLTQTFNSGALPASAPPTDVTRYTPHEIDIAVNAPVTGYVLINDQYDPDWEAELNDKPAPVLRADYLLRAVTVPPGASKLTLRYVAHYRVAGLSLPVIATNDFSDGIMLLAFIGAALLIRREAR